MTLTVREWDTIFAAVNGARIYISTPTEELSAKDAAKAMIGINVLLDLLGVASIQEERRTDERRAVKKA